MPRTLPCRALSLALLLASLSLIGCASTSAYAGIPSTPTVTIEPAESLAAVEVQPTEGPDPVATEYALAVLATSEPLTISNPVVPATPDVLKQMEMHAVKPAAAPLPTQVNDVPFTSFINLNPGVVKHVREIFAKGQSLGRNAHAFSKAGDSTIESPYFLGRFDGSPYNLGDYRFLQAVIDHFKGSFGRKSMAVRIGQHSWTLLNPAWADKQQCNADETPLACEFRQNNPSLVILRLGANDAGVPKFFDKNMRAVVDYTIAQGIIPVLSTKPDQREGTEQVNEIVRKIAADYRIPLWDFARVAETLPGSGLGQDGVHLTGFYQHDYTLPQAFQRGHGVQNLTALIVLNQIWQVLDDQ